MRLNKITYFAAAAALMLSMTSCHDFLDTMPDTRVELNSVEKARQLLTSSYPDNNPAIVGELMSDNMVDNNTADAKGTRYNLPSYKVADDEMFAFEDVKSGSDGSTPSGIWSGYYGSIAGANAALECLDGLQERIARGEIVEGADKIPGLRAEALLLRAFGHFMLASYFCMPYAGPEASQAIVGIPYITKPEKTVKPHYERPSLAYVYDMIEKDLTEALPLIDNSLYLVPKYHFNASAAYAFAARFYLWKRDYPQVIKYCNLCFGGENIDPSQYLADFWAHLDEFYYFSDFGLYVQSIERPGNFLLLATYSDALRHLSGGKRYAVNGVAKRATLQGPGPSWDSFKWSNSSTGESGFSMHPCFNGACGTNGRTQFGVIFAPNIAEQFEYTNKIAGIGYVHITRTEFTGEEVLLMRAEAKAFMGDLQGSLEDLKIWDNNLRITPNAVGMENRYKELTLPLLREFYVDTDQGDMVKNSDGERVLVSFGIAKPIHIDEIYPCEYSLTDANLPLVQCVQHFRRILTVHTGNRFLDLKRLGIEWSHKIGTENRIETMTLNDPRRAVQIPAEVLSAGFQPNLRPLPDNSSQPIVCTPM